VYWVGPLGSGGVLPAGERVGSIQLQRVVIQTSSEQCSMLLSLHLFGLPPVVVGGGGGIVH
jgi:hypothetical protein